MNGSRRDYWIGRLEFVNRRERATTQAIDQAKRTGLEAPTDQVEAGAVSTSHLEEASDLAASRTVLFLFVEFEAAVREAANSLLADIESANISQTVESVGILADTSPPLLTAITTIRRSRNAILHERAQTDVPAEAAHRTLTQFLRSLPDWT